MTERQRISSGSPYEPTIGFSRAVRVGNVVAVSGTAPVWPDGTVDPDPLVQARRCWEIALGALAEAGGRPEHVIRTRQFLVGVAPLGRQHRQAAEALDATQAGGALDDLQAIEEPRRARVAAADVEADHAPEPAHLALGDGVIGMRLEAGIVNAFDPSAPFELSRHGERARVLTLDPHRHRLEHRRSGAGGGPRKSAQASGR